MGNKQDNKYNLKDSFINNNNQSCFSFNYGSKYPQWFNEFIDRIDKLEQDYGYKWKKQILEIVKYRRFKSDAFYIHQVNRLMGSILKIYGQEPFPFNASAKYKQQKTNDLNTSYNGNLYNDKQIQNIESLGKQNNNRNNQKVTTEQIQFKQLNQSYQMNNLNQKEINQITDESNKKPLEDQILQQISLMIEENLIDENNRLSFIKYKFIYLIIKQIKQIIENMKDKTEQNEISLEIQFIFNQIKDFINIYQKVIKQYYGLPKQYFSKRVLTNMVISYIFRHFQFYDQLNKLQRIQDIKLEQKVIQMRSILKEKKIEEFQISIKCRLNQETIQLVSQQKTKQTTEQDEKSQSLESQLLMNNPYRKCI